MVDSQSARLVTSALWKEREEESFEAVAWPADSLMSVRRTFAPSRANAREMPAPKPEPPPEEVLVLLGERRSAGLT